METFFMKSRRLFKRVHTFAAAVVLYGLFPAAAAAVAETRAASEYALPLPSQIETILEESIAMRKSHRVFSVDAVTDSELSTILWTACGLRKDGSRTVAPIDSEHGAVAYVLKQDGAYKYNPLNHSLELYREGDFRLHYKEYDSIYLAPVQIILCWDSTAAGLMQTAAEMGEIGQTVLLAAVSLGMGSVVTAQAPAAFAPIGLPENELAFIMMPLGHLKTSYRFRQQPFRLSTLAQTVFSGMTLSAAVQERTDAAPPAGALSWQQQSQLIWAAYGFSPLRDRQFNFIYLPRHRTVPSPHYAYDAVTLYAFREDGVYRYIARCSLLMPGQPVIDFLIRVVDGDHRDAVARACAKQALTDAPLILLPVMDIEKARSALGISASTPAEYYQPLLYFVAGATAHNILLESTALNLFGSIMFPPDAAALLAILGLEAEVFQPLLVVSVGSKAY